MILRFDQGSIDQILYNLCLLELEREGIPLRFGCVVWGTNLMVLMHSGQYAIDAEHLTTVLAIALNTFPVFLARVLALLFFLNTPAYFGIGLNLI